MVPVVPSDLSDPSRTVTAMKMLKSAPDPARVAKLRAARTPTAAPSAPQHGHRPSSPLAERCYVVVMAMGFFGFAGPVVITMFPVRGLLLALVCLCELSFWLAWVPLVVARLANRSWDRRHQDPTAPAEPDLPLVNLPVV